MIPCRVDLRRGGADWRAASPAAPVAGFDEHPAIVGDEDDRLPSTTLSGKKMTKMPAQPGKRI